MVTNYFTVYDYFYIPLKIYTVQTRLATLCKILTHLNKTARWGIILLVIASMFQVTQAQVVTQRFPTRNKSLLSGSIPTLTLPPVDLTNYLLGDAQRTKDLNPFRFGANLAVDIDLLRVASRTDTLNNRIYRYQFYSAGAYSLNLILDQLHLIPGAQLYLYDPAFTMQIGPITDLQNTQTGEFWSDLIQGDRLILELREPAGSSTSSQVHLRSVVHGYRNVFPTGEKINESGSCEVNMACSPVHQFEGDGVVIILTQDGSAYCSGSILNDSRQSFRSFLLSANHCSVDDNSLIRFKYQSPTCTPTTAPTQTLTMNGSDFRATYASSDFSLRELRSQIPADANVTYLGWNRTNANVSNAFGIHHPEGDVKKISFTNTDTQISDYYTTGTTHLRAYWDTRGVTEPGSSGSPLFDGNGRIVGQLHGGPSTCDATGTNRSDYYGRIYSSWTGGGAATNRLSNWLDPTNRGNLTTDGVKPLLSGSATITNAGSFSINTAEASITSWSIAGGTGVISATAGTGNVASLAVLSSATSLTITFSVNAGQTYPIQFSQVFNAIKSCPGSVRYVRAGAAGNGCSWATASGDLQAMINDNGAQQIWVGSGLYKPTTTTDRTISFSMKNGVAIYGGFPGGGSPALVDRNPASYTTILSGDIGTLNNQSDNTYTVVVNNGSGLDNTAMLDGFIITGGNSSTGYGGGIYNSLSSPLLTNLVITGNSAAYGGGIANNDQSNPRLINCSISNNTAITGDGGGVYNSSSSPTLINCTLANNSAVNQGWAISSTLSSTARLTNTISWNNGGAKALYQENGSSLTVSYCLLESDASGYSDGGNNRTTSTSPFISATNLQLQLSSVAANGGSNTAYNAVSGPATDLAGNSRIQNDVIDIGAYESTLPADLTLLLYARPSTQYADATGNIVIDVAEVNSAPSSGTIVIKISKDSQLGISFNASLTTVEGRAVQNSQWLFNDTDPDYYILTTSQPIAAGEQLSVGLQSGLNSNGTTGLLTVSATLVGGSGGEIKVTNNTDADKVEYFQR